MLRNRKKIAIFTHNYPVTSKERKDAGIFIYDFAHELSKHCDVVVFCPDFGGKKENYKKVKVKWLDWKGPKIKFGNWSLYSPISVFNFFKLLIIGSLSAEKYVRENNIDYVLAAWTIPSSLYAYWVHLRLKTPYAVWILGSDLNIYAKFPILRQLTILALRNAKSRFSNSHWLMESTYKLCGKKCDYMAAITNFDFINVVPRKLDKKVFNFLFVGRLEKVKGPDVLINACVILSKKNRRFYLNILGDGSMDGLLKELIKKNKLEQYVHLFGNATKKEIASFMMSSDSLIVTSRAESIPLVMVEAARVGLPSVATDVGDCKRAIRQYDMGLVARSEDPLSVASAMKKAMEEGKNFKKNRRKGLKQISDDYKQTVAVQTLLNHVK